MHSGLSSGGIAVVQVIQKKEAQRRQGNKVVRPDSKYTARKRSKVRF